MADGGIEGRWAEMARAVAGSMGRVQGVSSQVSRLKMARELGSAKERDDWAVASTREVDWELALVAMDGIWLSWTRFWCSVPVVVGFGALGEADDGPPFMVKCLVRAC